MSFVPEICLENQSHLFHHKTNEFRGSDSVYAHETVEKVMGRRRTSRNRDRFGDQLRPGHKSFVKP